MVLLFHYGSKKQTAKNKDGNEEETESREEKEPGVSFQKAAGLGLPRALILLSPFKAGMTSVGLSVS